MTIIARAVAVSEDDYQVMHAYSMAFQLTDFLGMTLEQIFPSALGDMLKFINTIVTPTVETEAEARGAVDAWRYAYVQFYGDPETPPAQNAPAVDTPQ